MGFSHSPIRQHLDWLECPICHADIETQDAGSVYCAHQHCFDLSKKGYLNLLNTASKDQYSKALFRSRRIVCESGFFEPLLDVMVDWLCVHALKADHHILDAGCGEGSHLASIQRRLTARNRMGGIYAGFDISKNGIQAAAAGFPDILWFVADVTRMPFHAQKFDVILNILSPSHYEEFNRCLIDDGVLIKVIPSANYLKELRTLFFKGTKNQTYSNEETVRRFYERFQLIEMLPVEYEFEMNVQALSEFIQMTPLTWHIPEEKQSIHANSAIFTDSEILRDSGILANAEIFTAVENRTEQAVFKLTAAFTVLIGRQTVS